MSGDVLGNVFGALSQTFSNRLVRAWNRQALTATAIAVENELGQGDAKQVAWDVEFSGATAASFAEGSDVAPSEFNQDPIIPATLSWGQYRAPFLLSNLVIAAAQRNQAGAAALGQLVKERLFGSITKLMMTINQDLFSGTGTDASGNPNIVGLGTALTNTGTYAAINKGTYSEWQGNVLANGGQTRPLTFDLLANLEQIIFQASGLEPDFLVCSAGVLRKYENLFEVGKRTINDGGTPVGQFQGSTGLGMNQVRTNLFWRGKPVLRDRNCQANTLYMLNASELFIKPLPMAASPDGVPQTPTNLPSSNSTQTAPTSIMCSIYPLGRTGSAVKFVAEVYLQLKVSRTNAHGLLQDISEV